jgi:hypothetical protein
VHAEDSLSCHQNAGQEHNIKVEVVPVLIKVPFHEDESA